MRGLCQGELGRGAGRQGNRNYETSECMARKKDLSGNSRRGAPKDEQGHCIHQDVLDNAEGTGIARHVFMIMVVQKRNQFMNLGQPENQQQGQRNAPEEAGRAQPFSLLRMRGLPIHTINSIRVGPMPVFNRNTRE